MANNKATKQTTKKLNLKDRITDDSLDLNLSSLETVPVKDILEFPKVRKLNLSYNLLITLPDDFIKLQLIRELDLSKNKLVSLPKNFGCMVNLKSLDLLGNELTMLPTSFGELKSLQWLDLKDNPLKPALRQAAGDCFNEAQCKKCATNVINFMKNVAVEEERQRQADLKKKREEEAKLEAAEREKAKQLKAVKDQEREQRRLINEQRKKELQATKKEESNGKHNGNEHPTRVDVKKTKKSNCHGIITTLSFLLFVSLLFVTIYLLLNNFCRGGNVEFRKALLENKYLFPLMDKIDHHACPVLIKNKPYVKNILKSFEF